MKRIKKTGRERERERVLGKHVISLHCIRIFFRWNFLQEDTENDLTIRDQTAKLDYLLVCNFGNFHMSVLVTAHIVNSLDLSFEQSLKNQKYETN